VRPFGKGRDETFKGSAKFRGITGNKFMYQDFGVRAGININGYGRYVATGGNCQRAGSGKNLNEEATGK
jgi:hypothetical protein